MLQGEQSTNIESFRLKATDVQESLRNFPGYQVEQYYSLDDLQQGDTSGTTETDSRTAPSEGGYTKINEKQGKGR